ncbi:MAG: epoxyqueuosine reductase QueH [Treponema sp.]|nr:epoxyqueuosine reductase QueH [Treponema sp.]
MELRKLNYQKELEKILAQIETEKAKNTNFKKPTLLLHACCGPCSSYVIEYLAQVFDITIFYYNPNIHPREEYFRRLEELQKFLTRFPEATKNAVKLMVDEYNPEDYFEATNVRSEVELQTEPEKGERCRRCYKFRMERAYNYACEHHFDYFTTTLSISPHKDSEKINTIGRELEHMRFEEITENSMEEKEFAEREQKTNGSFDITPRTKFLPADFKKKGGFLRSTQLSEEYGLWRQDYCGCVYSKQNMNYTR